MTNWAQLIIGLLILTSCSKHRTKSESMVESEWIRTGTSSMFDSKDIGLVFRNDTAWSTSNRGWYNEGRYSIDGDKKITLQAKSDTTTWTIQLLTKDSLTILSDRDTLEYYNARLEFNNDLKYRRITLRTGLCFGGCQSFNVVLDEAGNVKFQGLKNGSVAEEEDYLMSESTRHRIDSLFKATLIAQIDSSKYYGGFDDWSMAIKFEYGDKEVKEIKGTRSYMPYRLQPIIGTLIRDLRERALIK